MFLMKFRCVENKFEFLNFFFFDLSWPLKVSKAASSTAFFFVSSPA